MAELALRGVCKRFGEIEAVRGIELELASGEFVVLLGPSGAGKTTTLRLTSSSLRRRKGERNGKARLSNTLRCG